ncbi:amino acid ABC transporter ATP-binding protein, PAAT family [Faunimonas pinastri]|uniref:Amino acid ABC transporter ATP-binding protein, PAAT family n=1 Tax=Faunimonas pinastri TaxID=1855383 RepID=A0A1H9E8I6_9HYPH|nr:amino acid ABC transporter ATP-binding protein [Faunimonas pinastri]SEQ22040.1 amino acid ABC transporter ATP-binding protein, PAAT family [Faunimonas pinastri]
MEPAEARRPPAILEVHGVVKRLGGVEVLKGINFTVAEGSVFAIIGASGSGKSTLLRCLNMLVVPDDGEIVWKGQRVGWTKKGPAWVRQKERELLAYRREVGMVFQSFNLFPQMTAMENIIEAPVQVLKRPRDEVVAEARVLLDKVRLSHRSSAYPHQMSGGEQQRVAIARALAMKPKALLFDEVTSALDPELKGEVLTVMRDLADEGLTMILVSHEMGFVRGVADEVLFMHKGVMCERGRPEEVLRAPRTPELQTFLQRVVD